MVLGNYNCIICAEECSNEEAQGLVLSKLNINSFKICQACFDKSDPSDDYRQAREIVNSYLKFAEVKHLFEVKDILNSRKR